MNAFSPVAGISVRAADLRDQQELRRLDAYVSSREEGQLFQRPQWSLAVERSFGQRAHYLIVESSDGWITGVLPLSHIRSRLFGSALVSAGFGVGGGILADDGATADALAEAAWKLAADLGSPTLELRGGHLPSDWQRREGSYASFVRALPASEEAILKSIPRKQRAEVRKALSFDLDVEIGRGERDLDAHYQVYSASVRNLGTPVFPRGLFREMLAGFDEQADILTVRKGGLPIASVFSFYFNDTVYPYWGGGTSGARASRANELMYFALMRHAAERGCTRFDFGRSKPGTGAFAFKKNWGFEPQPLVYAVRTADGAAPREINPLSPKYRLKIAAWQKLPLWLANRIGPPIARGLG